MARGFKRNNGYITNAHGVTITERQYNEFRNQVKAVNRFRERYTGRVKTALSSIGNPLINIDNVDLFRPKSSSFNRFKSQAQFKEVSSYYKKIYNIETRDSIYLQQRAENTKQGYINSILTQFGKTEQTDFLIDRINQFTGEELMLGFDTGALEHGGYVYYDPEGDYDKISTISTQLYDLGKYFGKW